MSKACSERTSISIHGDGGNIGTVHPGVHADADRRKRFGSGCSTAWPPNPWDHPQQTA